MEKEKNIRKFDIGYIPGFVIGIVWEFDKFKVFNGADKHKGWKYKRNIGLVIPFCVLSY